MDTGRQQASILPLKTKMAFCGFFDFRIVLWRVIGTFLDAVLIAFTFIDVQDDDTIFFTLGDSFRGTSLNARRIGAVVTG